MANTIPTQLQLDVVMQSAMEAFERELAPLKAFSTAYNDIALQGTDIMQVPFFDLETTASTDFNGTYSAGNTVTSFRPVTINKRKYQSMSLTSAELARQPRLDWEKLGMLKGQKLAADVIADILSVVTIANYGVASFAGAAATFDTVDVSALRTVANDNFWPQLQRNLVLNSVFGANLISDASVKAAYAYGTNGVIRDGVLPKVLGFDYYETPLIPLNAELLNGFICHPSAVIVGFSPITPHPRLLAGLVSYQKATNKNGLTLEYREFGTAGTDSVMSVIECNYGYAKGNASALKRITT